MGDEFPALMGYPGAQHGAVVAGQNNVDFSHDLASKNAKKPPERAICHSTISRWESLAPGAEKEEGRSTQTGQAQTYKEEGGPGHGSWRLEAGSWIAGEGDGGGRCISEEVGGFGQDLSCVLWAVSSEFGRGGRE